MSLLNRNTRRRLLDTLSAMAVFETSDGRNLLLHDLPSALKERIARASATRLDLDAIVDACDVWVPDAATAETYPLRWLIENALDLTQGGTQTERALRELLAELPARLDPQDQVIMRRACPYPG